MRGRSLLRSFAFGLACAVLMSWTSARAEEAGVLPPAHPALWRVQHEDSTLYLFGSLHILPPGYSWITPELEAALAASDRFIFEVPIDGEALEEQKQFIVEHGLLPRKQTLRGLLSPIEFQRYAAVLKRAGLKPLFYERYQPWLASLVLGLAYLYGSDIASLSGADDAIKNYAREHGKELRFLESPRDQLTLLTGGSRRGQTKALKNLIISLPRARSQQRDLLQTWSSGDADAFTGLLESYFEGRPEAQDLLLDGRNRRWVPALRRFLTGSAGTTMVTVGAAHLGGPMGLIALLCGQGFPVERMREPGNAPANACPVEF
jgi:uncharacterized protein